MVNQSEDGIQCGEFEGLISEAIDGRLSKLKLQNFRLHAESCPECGPKFAEIEAGREWLKSLHEIEPPVFLLENILVATTGISTTRLHEPQKTERSQPALWDRLRDWPQAMLTPIWAVARQPRFAMSFAMVFFSATLLASLAGVKLSDVSAADLRPSSIKRNYYVTTGRAVKYYENLRFVYELESRVREFKRATAPVEPDSSERRERKEKENKNNPGGQPRGARPKDQAEPGQERNYSQSTAQPILACAPDTPPVVQLVTNRRFS